MNSESVYTFNEQLNIIPGGIGEPLENGFKTSANLSVSYLEKETLNWILQTAEALQVSDSLIEPELNLSTNDILVGELDRLTSIDTLHKEQLFFLNLGGENNINYEGKVIVKGIESPAFQAPVHLQGQETEIITSLLTSLEGIYEPFNIVFTLKQPLSGSEYSTIYIGGNGTAFSQYGTYLGLAEKVDQGNQDKNDLAFVFTENLPISVHTASEYGQMLADYVAHEAGHLLGFEHEHTVHEESDPLAEVAFKPYTHVEIAKDVREDLLDDGMLTLAGQNYPVHPKILNAIRDYPEYYYAGTVGPDSFPDFLMGAAVIHAAKTGTWLTRVLDMAWQAQNDSSFSNEEKSQILAWSYGMLTHATGDFWAHTLVNEFAEGVFPDIAKVVSGSIKGETRELANAVRHILVESYIEDATLGFDGNDNRTILPDGDVSDDSTPGIEFAAPIRFIYESLIRPIPFDPTGEQPVPFTPKTTLTVNTNTNSFRRTTGSFLEDGFAEGQRFAASGFNLNNGDYRVIEVTATEIKVDKPLQTGDEVGSGDEQLVAQGKRGLAIDGFLSLRNQLEIAAKDRGSRIELGPLVADLIDDLVTGRPIRSDDLRNLYTAYLYNWVDNIDQGLRHWPEIGLAFTKAFFDAQSRRNLQNQEGAAYGRDTEDNTRRAEKENDIGVFDVMIEELDDPNGDGSTKDSFINNYLLPMFGLPREFGVMRSVLQGFGAALENVISGIRPLQIVINPILEGIDKIQELAKDFLKDQIEKRFGFDLDVFEFLSELEPKMDLASVEIGNLVVPVFKSGDREKLDAYLGLPSDAHNLPPSGYDSLPGVTFHPGTVGRLKDTISFSKTGFAAYANSVTLSKMLLLQEESVDGETTGINGLSQLFSNILTEQNSGIHVTYDASLLNLNGNHGGNILTITLPGDNNSEPWLASIDTDHAWRQDSLTTTTALFQVNPQNNGAGKAIWQTNVTPGDYTVQATWLTNVTQTVGNPERNLSPSTNATYKIYDGLIKVGTVTKDQRVFSTDAEDGRLSFTNLGRFTINSGTLRVELLTSGNGDEIAGPVRIVSLANNTAQRIQIVRDPESLEITPSGFSVEGTGWIDLKYDTGVKNFPLWESEVLRPVYRELFTDWENGEDQFPALGDNTSSDPNTSNITADALPSHATDFGPIVTDRENSIPIRDSVKTLILNGLDRLVELVGSLESSSAFSTPIPVINKTLAKLLKLRIEVEQNLRNPAQEYFNTDLTPTFAELFEELGDRIIGRINSITPILEFDLDIEKIIARNISLELENLGNAHNILGIDPELKTNVDFLAVFRLFDQQNQELPKFTVGIDLSSDEMLTIADRVFIKADHATINVDVAASHLNFDLNFENFLNPSVENGEVVLDGQVTFSDPDNNGRINLSELVDFLLSVSPSGTLDVTLPIHINNIYKKEILTIGIDDSNIFDSVPPNITNRQSFVNQLNIARKNNLDNLEYIIQEIGNGIQAIAKNLNPNTGIPFLDRGIEDLIEFSQELSDLSRNLAERSVIGNQEINANGVKLNDDAIFYLKLNDDNNLIGVSITKEETDNNQTLDDLVNDVNFALQRAGIGNVIEAITRNQRLILRTVNLGDMFSGDAFTIVNPNFIAQNSFGLTNQAASFKLLRLADIATIIKLDGNKVSLNIALNKTLTKPINLDFEESIETGIGDLKFIGKTDGTFTAEIDLDLELIIDLSLVGSNFDLNPSTLLSSFNGGRGISNFIGDGNDIKITLKDGTETNVNFDGDLTVGDVINSIKGVLGNKVRVEIDNNNKSLNLVDNTIGDGQFSIVAINSSLTGFGLGILGSSFAGIIQGISIGDGITEETPLLSLNTQSGVRINDNQVKWEVNLSDGISYLLQFTISNDTKLQDIINLIKEKTQNKVDVIIDEITKGLRLSSTQDFNITATNRNGIILGEDLGILVPSISGIIQGKPLAPNAVTQPQILTTDTKVYSLNSGRGIRVNQAENTPDLRISLKDNALLELYLVITETTTLGELINQINLASNGRFIATIHEQQDRLIVRDTRDGNFPLIITNPQGSFAATDLGILTLNPSETLQGKPLSQNINTEPKKLTRELPIVSLNNGSGIRINGNTSDLQINLRDGTILDINLATTITTIGQLIDHINSVANKKLIVIIHEQQDRFILIDTTEGTSQFTITDTPGSFAATDLGINGVSISKSGVVIGNSINQILDGNTPLSVINEINSKAPNQFSDLVFELRDGSHFEVDFKDFNPDITLQQIIDKIQEASKNEKGQTRLLVTLNENLTGLIISDTTTGNQPFKIEAVNGSLAGYDLGIINIESDGRIEGVPIHGDSLEKHVLLGKDSRISVDATVISQDIDLSAALGFVKLGVENGTADFDFTATGTLNSDEDIPLLELFKDFSLLNVTHSAQGDIHLPLIIQGLEVFDIQTPTDPQLNIQFTSTTENPFNYTITLENFDAILEKAHALVNLSTDDILAFVEQAINFLRDNNLSIFNKNIPLINKALNDILGFLQPIQEAYDEFTGDLKELKSKLLEDIKALESKLFEPALLVELAPNVLTQLKNAFDVLEDAIESIPLNLGEVNREIPQDLINAAIALGTIINELPNAALNDLVSQLQSAVNSLPNIVGQKAKEDIQIIINQIKNDPESVETHFDNLKVAVINLVNSIEPTLAVKIAKLVSILNHLELAAVVSTKDIPALLITLDTAINDLPDLVLLNKEPLKLASAKISQAIKNVDLTLLQEGLTDLTEALSNFPTPELNQILKQFETILSKLSGNISRKVFNEIQEIIPNSANLGRLLFKLLDLELPSFSNEIQQIFNNLNNIINQIPNELSSLKIRLTQINTTIQQAINELDPVLLSKAFADLEKEIETLPDADYKNLLKNLLNQFSDDLPEQLSLSINDDGDLIFGLDWNISETKNVPLNFGLADDDLRIPINFKTNGNLNIEVGLDLNLDFGLEGLNRVNPSPNFYLLPSTELELNAKFDIDNFEAEAAIGGISAITLGQGGTGKLSLKNGNDPARFVIELNEPSGTSQDGKILLSEVLNSIKFNPPQGQINLNLPVTLLNTNIGSIITSSDLSNLDEFQIQIPDQILENIKNAVLNYDIFTDGIDSFLDKLQEILELDILKKIPFIGDNIDSANSFITQLRTRFIDPLEAILNNPGSIIASEIQRVIWENLGSQALNIIRDNTDAGNEITIDDVIVTVTQSKELKIDLHLGGFSGITSDFDFNFDALGLELDTQGEVNIGLDYDFRFIVGISKVEGFFFELPNSTDFTFDFDITLNNASLEGNLFFLELTASNKTLNEASTNKDYNQDGDTQDTFNTGITGQFTLDLSSDSGDNKITLDELGQLDFDVDLQAQASVALNLKLSLGSRDLPSISTDLFIYTPIALNSLFGANSETIVSLHDITLNLGDFIRDTVNLVLKNTDTYLEPLRPVIDFLTSEVPIISDLMESIGLGKFTVLDAIALYDDSGNVQKAKQVLAIVAGIADFLDEIKNFDEDLTLNFGDHVIIPSQSQARSLSIQNLLEKNAENSNSLEDKAFALAPILKKLKDELGIEFPIFNISNIISLIIGQRADLITWELPKLDDIGFNQRYLIGPIFPPFPVFATIAARLEFFANLGMGLDTRGIIETGKFFDGFYFDDHLEGRRDNPELTLSAAFSVGAALSIQVAELGVEGGVKANFFADWNDRDRDGKVYFDEILSNARRHWLSVFDFGGELAAFFEAYLLIGFDTRVRFITIYEKRIPLFYYPLYQFGSAAQTDPPQSPAEENNIPSTLGHYSTGDGEDAGIEKGTLIIHTGRFAHLRQPGISQDSAEQIYITLLKSEEDPTQTQFGVLEVHSNFRPGYRQRSNDPHPTGTIQVFGDDENEPIVTKIYIDTGNGDDYVELDDFITADVTILGGIGDDTIKSSIDSTAYIEGGTGNDFISAGKHNDTIIGGVSDPTITGKEGKDHITGNGGVDLIFGDSGKVHQDNTGKITLIESIIADNGDDDVIIVGAGNDTVIGGAGDDFIGASTNPSNQGDDILFGDSGIIELNNQTIIAVTSINAANGGNDTITAGVGQDLVIGGAGNDLVTNEGDDNEIFFGDQGTLEDVFYDSQGTLNAQTIISQPYDNDGDDTLYGRAGNDTILGGGEDDYIEGVTGIDILFGDHGKILQTTEVITLIESIYLTTGDNGGNDTIDAGTESDTVIGGGKDDIVTNNADNSKDLIFGDQGHWDADLIQSLSAPDSDGNDTLYAELGNDTIIAGGKDDYVSGVGGEDILFGDHGKIELTNDIITRIISTDYANGGNDEIIAGTEKDTVLGGARNDLVTNNSDTSPDVIYGDQGYWDAIIISNVTDPNDGDDKIYSEGGNDTILAGGAKDYVESGNELDIILGDHGKVTRDADVVIFIETVESDSGDNDTIYAGNDDDTVFGGPKHDLITGDTDNNGDDILVGDQGYWNPTIIVSQFDVTSNPDGNDTIYGNGGQDTILGSDGKDYIEGNSGLDIALGDYGTIIHQEKIALRIDTTVNNVDKGNLDKGNDDYIHGGDQNDTLIGGTQNDTIFGGLDAGEDIILGDNGTVVNADGSLESNDIFSHTPIYGGLDRIAGGAGNDTIIGGSGNKDQSDPKATRLTGQSGDGIDGNEGDDIAIGDNAYITRNSDYKDEKITTTFTHYGGDDYILGSAGEDSLIAGFGKDSASGNDGNDIIFGDNALFDYLIDFNTDTLDRVITTDVTLGDKDTLTGDGGNDLIFGGTKEDSILGGSNNDLIFGDHALAEGNILLSALPLNQTTPPFTFTAIATQQKDLGSHDTISGNDGDDIILGQQGNDRLFGNAGDDDIIGGHNVAEGYDGGDEIDGGVGNDAIAGDNASIKRRADTRMPNIKLLNSQVIYDANGNPQVTDESQPNPTGVVGRNIQLFDHSTTAKTGTYGKDTIAGGANHDLIFGQLGDDNIQGDSATTRKVSLTTSSIEGSSDGDDYIEGGGGKDLIYGNLGQDDIIGGSSSLFGTDLITNRPDAQDTIFGGAGSITNIVDHSRDADVILGDNGNIYRLVNNSGQYLSFNYNTTLIPRAFQLLDTGNIGSDDLIYGNAGDDEIHGMTGNDVIFGEGGDDNIYGSSGHDRLYGGTGEDGIMGDDGLILTSRNGQTEPLYGINTANPETLINVPNSLIGAYINLTDRLKKEARLFAFNSGGNDVIYGGLGDDFLHGGAGDDAISGAEALANFYNNNPVTNFNPLAYNPNTGQFAAYNATNPRQKVNNFLLNFEAFTSSNNKINDGKDNIFGDLGNDWLVGGTQSDRLFGGAGNDLLNADDNHDTNNGSNSAPELSGFADADFVFGGSERDVLIANTGKDRLIDWFNNCNTYVVPFDFSDSPTIIRTPSPEINQFLLQLSEASGSDSTQTEPDGELGLSSEDDTICEGNPVIIIPGVPVDSLGGIEDDR